MGAGPTAVALRNQGAWVYGALVNNIWSDGNNFLIQPFANYNIPSSPGTYINFSPVVTANWDAPSGQQWTVPLGLGIGQITKLGSQPINAQVSAFYNVERPDNAARWSMRLQLQFLFPK